MADGHAPERPLRHWPEPSPDQIEVLLLGVYHMANPGNDEYGIEADDVLIDTRQRELEALVGDLAEWEPDLVAVEAQRTEQAALDETYEAYRSGRIDDVLDRRARRNELVQIGFRLAQRRGHQSVSAIDSQVSMDTHLTDEEDVSFDDAPAVGAVDYPLSDPEAVTLDEQTRLEESTIGEFLAFLNREPQLRFNGEHTFAAALATEEEPNAGARFVTAWYERNLRIVENLWRSVSSPHERVCLPIGLGHVRPLRHLLDEAPMFRPVSPLPYI